MFRESTRKGSKNMKIKRIITALLGFPLVAILLIFGDKYVVDIAFSIVAILAVKEILNAFSKKSNPVKWIAYLACIFIAFIHIIPIEYVIRTIRNVCSNIYSGSIYSSNNN